MTAPDRAPAVLLQAGEDAPGEPVQRKPPSSSHSFAALAAALVLGAFWLGAAAAFLWGYFGAEALVRLAPPFLVLLALAVLMPPFLFLAAAWTITRGQAIAAAGESLVEAADRLLVADETSARTAARLGRAVRRELDGLNAGLDSALARLRALEGVIESQVSALDEAGARADVRAEAAASRLAHERERLDALAGGLSDAAARASELVAGRSAQLKATIESAESALKSAGNTLEAQATAFRTAADAAAEAPHGVAVELDRQSKRIEAVADAALARAEFVLGRHERQRSAMMELLQRLKDDGTALENALAMQKRSLEDATAAVSTQFQAFEGLLTDAERRLEVLMATSAARATQLASNVSREVDKLKELSEGATGSLTRMLEAVRDAGTGAQTLIGETTAEAKANAKALVGSAMAECEKLIRAAGELSTESKAIGEALGAAVEDMQAHLLMLPGVAKQEAQRVRDLVRHETEEMLDLSARTLATMHARQAARTAMPMEQTQDSQIAAQESEGLMGLARRLTQRGKRRDAGESKAWEISTLLAAAEISEAKAKDFRPEAAAALGALQAVLADLAIDLDLFGGEHDPEEEWRRYLGGDRSVFARRLAQAIDSETVDRIMQLYRDQARFRDAANVYIAEFEMLLARAREGDSGGILASTILSADTGKIYLALAYALGRLS